MSKTRRDNRDKFDFYDEGRKGKKGTYRRNPKHSRKPYKNISVEEVLDGYNEDDMVGND